MILRFFHAIRKHCHLPFVDPSEAVTGSSKAAFEGGIAHYDQPPPGELGPPGSPESVAGLQQADRFRFANVLSAWIDTDDHGAVIGAGYHDDSRGLMGATTVRVGAARRTFQAVRLPDLRRAPEHGDGWVRFTRPSAAGRAFRRRAGSRTRRSCSGRRRPCGPRSR